tara:strand:+ start:5312 stop:5491 length:180 start_codon:yes stop_codon:yes gene_type:complete
MVHRIKPPVTNRRWTITTFVSSIRYKGLSKKDLSDGFKKYFAQDPKILYNIKNMKGNKK